MSQSPKRTPTKGSPGKVSKKAKAICPAGEDWDGQDAIYGSPSAFEKRFLEPVGTAYERKLQGLYAFEAEEAVETKPEGSDEEADEEFDESMEEKFRKRKKKEKRKKGVADEEDLNKVQG